MYRKILIIVLGLVLFSACSEANEVIGGSDLAENDLAENDLAESDLAESEWVLTLFNGEPLLEGTNITLAFHPGELGGFAGCNGYGSRYELSGEGEIQVLEIVSRAEGCVEPDGVLDQESEYLKQLLNSKQYKIDDSILTLSISTTEQTLVYSLREPFVMEPTLLENTQWNLVASDDFPLIDGSAITLSFSEGEIEGYGGCRDYAGEYKAEGDQIVFPVMMMLSEICDDLDLQIQESTYTTWLELTTHYRVQGDQLEFYLATGDSLLFETLK
jgi:heat shock protein HslJ